VAIVAAIWLHTTGKLLRTPTVYLLIVCCLWASLQLLRTCQILYRSFSSWKHTCKVAIAPLPDAYQIHIKIPRPWKYRAGQYVYLCLPFVSYKAVFQSHPYMVAWWYCYEEQDVVVLIVERRAGFTHKLPIDSTPVRAMLEGPYGNEIHVDQYGTVLLFATGIGIAGQLPYVRQLLEKFEQYNAKARRVALFWQVGSEGRPY
jgi:predicted ferric reductase